MHKIKPAPPKNLGQFLLAEGLLTPQEVLDAQGGAHRFNTDIGTYLISEGLIDEDLVTEACASFFGLPFIDLEQSSPAQILTEQYDPAVLLRHKVTPWRRRGSKTLIAASNIEDFNSFAAAQSASVAELDVVMCQRTQIIDHITQTHSETLTQRAATRVNEAESCRTWQKHTNQKRLLCALLALTLLVSIIVLFPTIVFAGFALWAIGTLLVSTIMKLLAFTAEVSTEPNDQPPQCPDMELPRISVLVPLFKEREIASALLTRLDRLTYPKSKLEVILAIEEHDTLTRSAVSRCCLPSWIKVVTVPEGAPKTKPRAMNYALDFCAGDIIGIWDAEDAPMPNQLFTVANHFASAPENVVCLQGALDYYNSRQNWLARCFTIEYAAWFRLILPGMARLSLAIPLGGTTLFIKRDALEKLGGWDAHNVTEDADLGFRLARHGYRTDVISIRTDEEANCKPWAWVRQRSRWLKGYMVTYLVHVRQPAKLRKQLGFWRFVGFQAHFVTALSQFFLAPVLWSFWLVLLGFAHPMERFVNHELLVGMGVTFLMIELLNALINAKAVSGPRHRHLLAWVPTMHFYYPLGALAAYKALYELIGKPFYWDKTAHGLSLNSEPSDGAHSSQRPPAGVKLQASHKGF